MKKPLSKLTKFLLAICITEIIIIITLSIAKFIIQENSKTELSQKEIFANIENANESPEHAETTEPKYYSVTGELYENCDHEFSVYRTEAGIMSSCDHCYMPQWRLAEMGVLTEEESCDHAFESIRLANGMPAYKCYLCGDMQELKNPNLDDLQLLADSNPEGMGHEVAVGTFTYGATDERFDGAVRFQVAEQSGRDNTESAEFLLAGACSALNICTRLEPLADEGVNMTVRCYGDGEILYQIENITPKTTADETAATIEVFGVEVLRIECTATTDVEGSCLVQGVLGY